MRRPKPTDSSLGDRERYILRIIDAAGVVSLLGVKQHVSKYRPDITRDAAQAVVNWLVGQNLIKLDEDGYVMTEEGKAALK